MKGRIKNQAGPRGERNSPAGSFSFLNAEGSSQELLIVPTEDKRSDEEILSLSLKTPSAFQVLVERYQAAFLRKAKSLVRLEEDAEDAVQDTFAKIYLNGSRFRVVAGASFKSWAYKILINTCFTLLKKRRREQDIVVEMEPEAYEAIPDRTDNAGEMRLLLDEALSVLSRLPNAAADILEMYFVRGKSQQAIAQEKGISIGAVRTRIHRAKKEFEKISADIVT